MAEAGNLRIAFSLRGTGGLIAVAVTRNADPGAIGYSLLSHGQPVDFARDFPVCRATVTYPADGYAAVFGWTQMVRSTDSASAGFEMDPIAIYRDVATPYAWYSVRPELFDAPSRGPGDDLDWEAHSFLCVSPDAVITPHVQAIRRLQLGLHPCWRRHQPHPAGRAGTAELGRPPGSADHHLSRLDLRRRISWCLIVASIRIARQDVTTTRSAAK